MATHCRQNHPNLVVETPNDLRDPSCIERIQRYGADVFVVVAFSLLPEEIFSIPPKGTFNIHGSLLPAYRGPAPIHRAIAAGETETGVTVFRIDHGVDTGAILLQRTEPIFPDDTTPTLYHRLSLLGGEAIVDAFGLLENNEDTYVAQDERRASRAPLLRKSEERIDWSEDARVIERKIRAFIPFPGSATLYNGQKLTLTRAQVEPGIDGAPGEVVRRTKKELIVACGVDGLKIERLKPQGRKEMPIDAYLNGSSLKEGCMLDEAEK
ncbi:methionyl-tRNA formyltransferase [Chitinivibrio alkaliphilus ACht1]|uniref:methionyl-tRNA formyltransferase n=1 Tax=Chitinivibrio alkaliphilus ACht1 TaxID=1313304 RepID=U7D5N3_9BACT|nr:methionyl-tRNA formyltransferase [Chitinivibrio alkaliphilus ACht1]